MNAQRGVVAAPATPGQNAVISTKPNKQSTLSISHIADEVTINIELHKTTPGALNHATFGFGIICRSLCPESSACPITAEQGITN